MHLYLLELSNSAGDGRLWFKGVVMYDRIARCGSSPPSMAFVRLFFIVCTKHSACPLDCICWRCDCVLYALCFGEVFELL